MSEYKSFTVSFFELVNDIYKHRIIVFDSFKDAKEFVEANIYAETFRLESIVSKW